MSVEILAPGGSVESIYAGLSCGADAIYTGTSRFSARAFAQNPTVEELCEILDFAHLHGKKIYLTTNTLLKDHELEDELFELLNPLYQHGLDAVIVQDMGVLDWVHSTFPDMDIHASTQMTLCTAEAANLLLPYGITRVVPARELSIEEIQVMRSHTNLELEVFVHGALCYCYSGQCLMSQVIGGRSGNRGMCAQPCRLPFEVEGRNEGYALSLKDLCTLDHVGELISAGIDSFKIEGRMKKPAYTAYTSHLYRLYADAYLAGRNLSERELQKDLKRLADIYNRGGFSDGYLFEKNKKNIRYAKKNGHFGVKMGTVTQVNPKKNMATYELCNELYSHDVVEFRDEKGDCIYEYTVKDGAKDGTQIRARFQRGSEIRVGQSVYRTRNQELLDEIEQMIEKNRRENKIEIQGEFKAKIGEPCQLQIQAGNELVTIQGPVAQTATGRPVESTDVEKRLQKTGESLFEFAALTVDVEKQLFLPMGALNALRREAFAELEQKIVYKYHRDCVEPCETYKPIEKIKSETLLKVTNYNQFMEVLSFIKENKDTFYIPVLEWEEMEADMGKVLSLCKENIFYILLPPVFRKSRKDLWDKKWKEIQNQIPKDTFRGILLPSMEAVSMAKEWSLEDKVWMATPNLYQTNARSAKVYQRLGMEGHVSNVYGRTQVMISEGCVNQMLGKCTRGQIKPEPLGIRTPKKDEFVVVSNCTNCYNKTYEKNASFQDMEYVSDVPMISFTWETPEEVRKVLKQWKTLS